MSVVDKSLYVLFGKHEDDNANSVCPPMQVLNTEDMSLKSPESSGLNRSMPAVPEDREGHTASVVGRRIYIFGGTWTDEDDQTIYMNDLHILDVDTLIWSRPGTDGTPPIEREGHTAATIGSRIFIFGGTWVDDEDNSIYLNDLHILETDGVLSWSPGESSGEPPTRREGHTASPIGTMMVVFGGAGFESDGPINLNDLHILCTEAMRWSQPNITGKVPKERRYHSASVIDQRLLVFGGQYFDSEADLHFECDNAVCTFDMESMSWCVRLLDPWDVLTRMPRYASRTLHHPTTPRPSRTRAHQPTGLTDPGPCWGRTLRHRCGEHAMRRAWSARRCS